MGNITASRNVTIQFNSFALTGIANASFSSIGQGDWGEPWTKRAQQTFPTNVHTVHLIFMNHLGT